MAISTASRKQKGRKLQQWVRDTILKYFPALTDKDVRSTSMGASGVDVTLSTKGAELFPMSIECKAHARFSIYEMYEQAVSNADGLCPLLIIKGNGKKPLAVLDAEQFIEWWSTINA